MDLGLTRSELGLVVFIFLLVYGVGHLPKLENLVTSAFRGPKSEG
jgi:hypothetical protein